MNLEVTNLQGRIYLADKDSFIDIDTIYDEQYGHGARVRACDTFSYWVIIKEDIYASFLYFRDKEYYIDWRKENPEYRIYVTCENFTQLIDPTTTPKEAQ